MAIIEIPSKYAFPLFTKHNSTDYLIKNDHIRVSDIWSFWQYIIGRYVKKYSGEKTFLQTLLEQAKYFYSAAEDAPIKSQPLLYYYSFLNLVKVVINVNVLTLYGSTIEYDHGVRSCDIHKETSLNEMFVTVLALNGSKKLSVDYSFMKQMGDQIIAPPYKIQVEKLLKQCVGIHRTFCETYNCNEIFFRTKNLKLYREGLKLYSKYEIGKCNADIQASLIAAGYNIISESDAEGHDIYYWQEETNMTSYHPTKWDYYMLANKIRQKGIWYYTDGDNYHTYISSDSLHISTESIIYNLMFFFGSITRYHPYMFDKLLSDQQMWLISEFLKTQPMQFLHLVTSRTIESSVLKPKTANIL